jgi:glutathione S-transferase
MLTLCGFAFSNYHSKVKLALLEKQIPHEDELNWARKDDATLALSPLGKVPFLRTDEGGLSESHVILEYLEEAFPERPLLPSDPWQRAKVRELIIFLELHLELVARPLYPQAFFGGKVPDSLIERTRPMLERNVAAFARLAKFSPFLAGDSFTMADCAGYVHLPVVSMASKAIWGEDLLASLPVREYLKRLGERETVQRVAAERKANGELMAREKPSMA